VNIEFCSAGRSGRPIVPSSSYQKLHIRVLMEMAGYKASIHPC